ncbi:uncharacterized protein LOC122035041 isoform X1 [Zingiber officinale]|uniref:uncharacterized protein LOC122035041 isoform X1 n=3 Tax=Zingiber officinale TaxID=94328 RepID=UPI001C4CAFB2|nr:uncharacterized protein LOC122035041 isoform X1 [Zingiber officinale]XP_042450338.1 uncharacterized protein LOC122035041 isoform X1 [Zingiber officinale]
MGFRENLDFYLKMSRKELQQLCKQHDLPANTSHAILANSLASHFQKRNAVLADSLEKSVNFMDGSSKKLFASEPITKKTVPCPDELTTGNRRLFCQLGSKSEINGPTDSIMNEKPETVTKVLCPLWPVNSKEQKCIQGAVPCGHSRPHEYSMESGLVSGNEISTRSPPFQFFVMSEGGIDLFVDLNSSPLELINSLKENVCVHQNTQYHESMAPPEYISNSPEVDEHMKITPSVDTGMNLNGIEVEKNTGCTNSSLSSVVSENSNSEAYPPDTTAATSGSFFLVSNTVPVGSLGFLEENQVVSSSCAAYTVQNHLASHMASCPPEGQETAIVSFAMVRSNASLPVMPLQSVSNMDNGVNNPVTVGVEVETLYDTVSDVADKDNLTTRKEISDNIDTLDYVHQKNHRGASESFTGFKNEQPDNTTFHGRLSNSCQHSGQMILDSPMADAQSEVGTADLPFCRQSCSNCETLVPEEPISMSQDESGHSTPMGEKDASECSRILSTSANTKRSNNLENPKEPHVKRHHVCSEIMSEETVTKLRNSRSSAKKMLSGAIVLPRRSMRLVSKVYSAPLLLSTATHNRSLKSST